MEFRREGGEGIRRVPGKGAGRVERHLPGACMTVPQALQVRCEALE